MKSHTKTCLWAIAFVLWGFWCFWKGTEVGINYEKQRGGRMRVDSILTPQKQRCEPVCKTPMDNSQRLEGERFPNLAAALTLLWKAESACGTDPNMDKGG